MQRHVALATIVSVSSLAVAAGAVYWKRPPAAAGGGEVASCGMPLGESAAARLPPGTVLMASAAPAQFTGKAVCGHCRWGIGDSCNVMLHDEAARHVLAVLPNDQRTEIEKLVGT